MLIATGNSQESNYELIPAGLYTGICYGLVDIGLVKETYDGREKVSRKVMLLFELPDETVKNADGEAITRTMSREFNLSLDSRSNLSQILSSWLGKVFTDEEITSGYDLRKLLGKGCQLSIVHKASQAGRNYAKINSIVGLPKGMEAPTASKEQLVFDLDDPGALDAMALLPEWVQSKIKQGETYKGLTENQGDLPFSDEDDLPF